MTIYTITPNPVLDLSGTTRDIVPNEKNYILSETRSAGGNGINAAQIAHRLGKKVIVSGFLGGAVGQEMAQLLKEKNISQQFIKIKKDTRINLTISNLKTHQQTRFSFPGPAISLKEKKLLQQYISKLPSSSLVIFGGSLPHNVASKDITQMIKYLNKKKSICIVDMPGLILKEIISAKPFMIKPNLSEFQTMVGKKVKTIEEVITQSKKLLKDVPVICISSVENGALLVTKNKIWFGRIPKVKIYSSVGAGDSMVGAFAADLASIKNSNEEKLDHFINLNGSEFLGMALAAACATLTNPGLDLGNKKTILHFFPKVTVKELFKNN